MLSARPAARRHSAMQQERWSRHARDAAAGRQVLHILLQLHSLTYDWDDPPFSCRMEMSIMQA